MKRISSVNDCVIRFANVNGSGSASANNLFAKAVFRMGVPVSPKNIFPSNIQGLPTWYEVRVNDQGYIGRRGDVDMVVAMNGQTMLRDYMDLLSGGYFIYDSSRQLADDFNREDVIEIGLPLTSMCNGAFENPRMRSLLKNIIYVGALAFLLDMEFSVLTESVEKQFRKKTKLMEPNLKALHMGYEYAREQYPDVCQLKIERRDKVGDAIMMDGNTATGLGAIYGGATVVGWYPITPSTSVIEAFGKYADQLRVEKETGRIKAAIVQAEDELAALGIVIGATWNGARAFTATSGPGVSLMNEFLGLAYYAEIPVVLVDVQRAGPSTGLPTRTQQSDVLSCAYASHGDTQHVLLFPASPYECFEMTADAFDLADRLQTPVIVLSDLDLGMNDHLSPPLVWDDSRTYDRGKVLNEEQLLGLQERWGRYLDVDGDGICYRTYPGTSDKAGAYFTRGSAHDEYSVYSEDAQTYEKNMQRLQRKMETAVSMLPAPEIFCENEGGRIGVIYFGTSSHAAEECLDRLNREGIPVNGLRVRAFPFHQQVSDFIDRHDKVLVLEQNRDGQLRTLLINECEVVPQKLISVVHYDGLPLASRTVYSMLADALQKAGQHVSGDDRNQGGAA
ncbi:2-oxoacid:acceptor oxidoreductase subunit alpha [Desulfogranum japonicum]|uniref:2-oxoacid:acceptor oxidoreductase subunit alpha n=1 Tax=Desulfogranum japonicum TaxID=231447 RepID=UPI000411F1E6|nr:2-oxoacid:acceptor oxidoreductase subunit alpha [Desulfogranum japonicum]